MNHPELPSLLIRLRNNDQSALREVFDAHYSDVCRAMYRLLRDQGEVEDLAQEVFIRFWNKRQELDIQSNLGGYLRRMGVNEALAFLRKKKYIDQEAEVPEISEAPTGEATVMAGELKDRIQVAMNQLPPRCRLIFQLSRQEQLTYREIAERLDLSVKTVEHQMGKALRQMRAALHEYF
jgi:RNA polymerase sigma-70 factor (ECF subfamily)